MLENRKHVFWQAFFLTLLFFILGLIIGVYIEQMRTDSVNTIFYQSEVSLYDSFGLERLTQSTNISCDLLKNASLDFADKIYNQAIQLEQFDNSNQLTDSIKLIHAKYDLLRTLLWMNLIPEEQQCPNLNVVVYLYVYDTTDINLKAEQTVFKNVLSDLKNQKGNNIILIPIAVDQNISSLNYLLQEKGINNFPAVIVNEKNVFYNLTTSSELSKFLVNSSIQ